MIRHKLSNNNEARGTVLRRTLYGLVDEIRLCETEDRRSKENFMLWSPTLAYASCCKVAERPGHSFGALEVQASSI